MSKSNPFAAPKALVETPGALEAIADAVANNEPKPVNHGTVRQDAGAEEVNLTGEGDAEFRGIDKDGDVADPNPPQDSGADKLVEEAQRAADATTDNQTGEQPYDPNLRVDEDANVESDDDAAADSASESDEGDDEATDGDEKPAEVDPEAHSKDELVEMADKAGVAHSGSKAEIAARINEKNAS
jgi:hypothetical protein